MGWTEYNYLFVFALIFAFIDAFGIGANDVANSFATSVSSRSLTFKQAMLAAALCEFLGAVLVGARVASTVKSGIIDLSVFRGDASMVLLGFTCVIVASATWLTIATRNQMPVSTTHTVIGSLIGVGIAAGGGNGVKWGWNGVGQVIASWGISPALAGCISAIVFTFTRLVVLKHDNAVKRGLWLSPFYFFIVGGVLTTSIIVKGSPSLGLDELPTGTQLAAIFGTASVITVLAMTFWLPYVYCKVVRNDSSIRFYHFFTGPYLWFRPTPEAPTGVITDVVPDYYEGHRHEDFDTIARNESAEIEERREVQTAGRPTEAVSSDAILSLPKSEKEYKEIYDDGSSKGDGSRKNETVLPTQPQPSKLAALEKILGQPLKDSTGTDGRPIPPNYRTFDGTWLEPWNLWIVLRYNALPWVWFTLSAGLRTDIHKAQNHGSAAQQERLRDMHSRVQVYDNKVEHLFSFLQICTACTASFAHGANDVSNAVGPLSVVYAVWSTQLFPESKEPTPVWVLAFGGAGIVIGLGLYGYKLMSVLGNRLTPHSPSRGFSMEFSASIVVVLASLLALPVSSTQTITGATVGVALSTGDYKTLNLKMLGWIFFSWVLTLPIAGLLSGCLFGIIANAPRFA